MTQNKHNSASPTRRCLFSLLIISFLAMILLTDQVKCVTRRGNWPLARNQRQIITNELASGFSGTGTSFNSFYGDPYYSQQQQTIYQTDENDYPGSGYPGSKRYVPTLQTNRNLVPSYGSYGNGVSYSGDGSYGLGAQGGWRGFGATKGGGKGPSAGRPPFYGGVKY